MYILGCGNSSFIFFFLLLGEAWFHINLQAEKWLFCQVRKTYKNTISLRWRLSILYKTNITDTGTKTQVWKCYHSAGALRSITCFSPHHLGTICCTHSSISVSVLVLRSLKLDTALWCNLLSVKQKQRNISPDLLATLMPDMQGFFATLVQHHWLAFTLSSLKTPRFFSAKLCTSWSVFSLYCHMGLFSPCRILHLSLLNFLKFLPAHFCILLTVLWMALPISLSELSIGLV